MKSTEVIIEVLKLAAIAAQLGYKISNRKIERQITPKVCHQVIGTIRKRFAELELTLDELIENNDDKEILDLFHPDAAHYYSRANIPDLETDENRLLNERHLTRNLLIKEHLRKDPTMCCPSTYYKHLDKYRDTTQTSMRQCHHAGELLFIDYAGAKISYQDQGNDIYCNIFVATQGCSKAMFAMATLTKKTEDWVRGVVAAIHFFGGLTEFVIPDNDVALDRVRNGKQTPLPYICALIEHYKNLHIDFTRPGHPQDKPDVEKSVRDFYTYILAKAAHLTFFSLDELNDWILFMVKKFNSENFQGESYSREDLLNKFDKPKLLKVDEPRFEMLLYIKERKVQSDYYIKYKGHYYMVPYTLVGQHIRVEARFSNIKFIHQRKVVAEYPISTKTRSFSWREEYLDPKHKFVMEQNYEHNIEWASGIGKPVIEIVELLYAKSNNPASIPIAKHCLAFKKLYKKVVGSDVRKNKKLFLAACAKAKKHNRIYAMHIENIYDSLLYESKAS